MRRCTLIPESLTGEDSLARFFLEKGILLYTDGKTHVTWASMNSGDAILDGHPFPELFVLN